jgi:hypothetical protein
MTHSLRRGFVMNLQQASGIVISSGFILYVIAGVVAPGLYGDENIANRLAIIAANQVRWNLSQLFFALGLGVPAAGFLLLALSQRDERATWLYYLGAASYGGGSLIGMVLVYRQTLDPAAFWEGGQLPLFIAIMLLLLSAGLFCFGLAMLQGDNLPNWLGYLLTGSAVIFLIATLVLRGEGGFFISVALLLITFIAGIVIWRQQPK